MTFLENVGFKKSGDYLIGLNLLDFLECLKSTIPSVNTGFNTCFLKMDFHF